MKKIIKIVSIASLCALAFGISSFAGNKGWVNNGDNWSYYDNTESMVTDTWKMSGNSWFYLNSEGVLATDCVVETNNKKFYVDEHGAMVKNSWVAVPDDDTDLDINYRWYYFGNDGAAYKQTSSGVSTKTINGKKYAFDTDGKMLFGFVDESGSIVTSDDAVLSSTYYFGTNDDGEMKTGWMKYTEALTEYDNYDYVWIYYNTNGKKVVDSTKNINGKKYSFDSNGVMNKEWNIASGSNATSSQYFSSLDDGAMKKKTWVHAVPSADINSTDYDDDTARWFYVDASGKIVTNTTKKINNHWYVFDDTGIMKTGIVTLSNDRVSGSTPVNFYKLDETAANDIYALSGSNIYFFSATESDGSMKTGNSIKIDLSDDTYTFGFNKQGLAYNGVEKNKLYKCGILQTAGDDKYAVKNDGNKYYVVNSSGIITKSGHSVKDANDNYFAVKGTEGDISSIKCFAGEDASKAAAYYAKNGTLDGIDSKYSWSEIDFNH